MKCALPECNKKARRKFCSNKHKDKYHNRYNPRGFYGRKITEVIYDDYDEGPEGWDGHK